MENKLLMVAAIVAVCFAVANLGIVIFQTNRVNDVLLAPTDVGYGQVQIISAVHIQFNVPILDWGAGSVLFEPAVLNSTHSPFYANWTIFPTDGPEDVGPDGTVMEGGLELENYGNTDVDLWLATDENRTNFICQDDSLCGATDLAELNWWLEDLGTTLGTVAACTSTGGEVGNDWTAFTNVCKIGEPCDTGGSSPGDGILICDDFEFNDVAHASNNEIEIDMELVVPMSAPAGKRDEAANRLEITATVLEST